MFGNEFIPFTPWSRAVNFGESYIVSTFAFFKYVHKSYTLVHAHTHANFQDLRFTGQIYHTLDNGNSIVSKMSSLNHLLWNDWQLLREEVCGHHGARKATIEWWNLRQSELNKTTQPCKPGKQSTTSKSKSLLLRQVTGVCLSVYHELCKISSIRHVVSTR